MAKAYYLDTDNICNFKIEYKPIIKDFVKGDIIYLIYTREGNKSKALNSLMYLHHIGIDSIKLLQCEPGFQSLDLYLIEQVQKHKNGKSIIVSNDKGFDDFFKDSEDVERRGTLEIDEELKDKLAPKTKEEKSMNIAEAFRNISKGKGGTDSAKDVFTTSKEKMSRLDNLLGKYVVANVSPDGRIFYLQDTKLDPDRTWTQFLDGAYGYINPEYTKDSMARFYGYKPFVIYITDNLLEREKADVYKFLYKSLENVYNG